MHPELTRADTTAPARRYQIAHYPVVLIDRLVLRDGRVTTVRPVLPQDAPQLQSFVEGLSDRSRYQRFHYGLRHLPVQVLREFTELDYREHLGLIAEVFSADGAQTVIADARLVRSAAGDEAELAIAVADDWQRLGLGARLLRRLLAAARCAGVARVSAELLADNAPMHTLLLRHGFRVAAHPQDARLLRAHVEIDQGVATRVKSLGMRSGTVTVYVPGATGVVVT